MIQEREKKDVFRKGEETQCSVIII